MLNYDHWSGIEIWMCQMKCSKCRPASFTHSWQRLWSCERSEQPLPLASEEVRSRSSAMWFEVTRSFMAFSLACGQASSMASHYNRATFLLSQRLNSKFCVLSSGETLPTSLTLNYLHLKKLPSKNYQRNHRYFVYNFKFHLTMTSHVTSIFGSCFHVFSAYPQGCEFWC